MSELPTQYDEFDDEATLQSDLTFTSTKQCEAEAAPIRVQQATKQKKKKKTQPSILKDSLGYVGKLPILMLYLLILAFLFLFRNAHY